MPGSDGQQFLDRAFNVSPEDRAVLRTGSIPAQVQRRLQTVARSGLGRGLPALLLLAMPLGAALAVLVGPTARVDRLHLLWLAFLVPIALVVRLRLLEWRHERRVFAERPALRTLEGSARTIRTWNYGYGECYQLRASLEIDGRSDAAVDLSDELGSHVISGWVRVFVATVPTRKPLLAPYYETAVAVEIAEDTDLEDRAPGKPAPGEPLLIGVPAD